MGLEPTTFELEVQHANPLRHGGGTYTEIYFSFFIIQFLFSLMKKKINKINKISLSFVLRLLFMVVLCTEQMVVPVI